MLPVTSPLSNSSFIQNCDSNIQLFSFASYKVIALPTIATAIVVALTRYLRRERRVVYGIYGIYFSSIESHLCII